MTRPPFSLNVFEFRSLFWGGSLTRISEMSVKSVAITLLLWNWSIIICSSSHKIQDYDDSRAFSQTGCACLRWSPWISVNGPFDFHVLNADDGLIRVVETLGLSRNAGVCTVPVSSDCRALMTTYSSDYDAAYVPCPHLKESAYDASVELRFLCWDEDCPCLEWSKWYNRDTPRGNGDFEILGKSIPNSDWPCPDGTRPLDVQCVQASGLRVQDSKDHIVKCNLEGFYCLNGAADLSLPRHCNDYKVRFLCLKQSDDGLSRYTENGFKDPLSVIGKAQPLSGINLEMILPLEHSGGDGLARSFDDSFPTPPKQIHGYGSCFKRAVCPTIDARHFNYGRNFGGQSGAAGERLPGFVGGFPGSSFGQYPAVSYGQIFGVPNSGAGYGVYPGVPHFGELSATPFGEFSKGYLGKIPAISLGQLPSVPYGYLPEVSSFGQFSGALLGQQKEALYSANTSHYPVPPLHIHGYATCIKQNPCHLPSSGFRPTSPEDEVRHPQHYYGRNFKQPKKGSKVPSSNLFPIPPAKIHGYGQCIAARNCLTSAATTSVKASSRLGHFANEEHEDVLCPDNECGDFALGADVDHRRPGLQPDPSTESGHPIGIAKDSSKVVHFVSETSKRFNFDDEGADGYLDHDGQQLAVKTVEQRDKVSETKHLNTSTYERGSMGEGRSKKLWHRFQREMKNEFSHLQNTFMDYMTAYYDSVRELDTEISAGGEQPVRLNGPAIQHHDSQPFDENDDEI